MSVYLIHRDPYRENCKALKKFPMSNIVEWSQIIWDKIYAASNEDEDEYNEEAHKAIKNFIGFEVYGINVNYFKKNVLNRPENITEATFAIEHIFYHSKTNTNNKNFIQLLGYDDAPLEYAVYLFDEIYAKENPGIASYLLAEDFRLPGIKKSNNSIQQGLHMCFENHWSTSCLSKHTPNTYIPGIGLNDLPLYLSKAKPTIREWPDEMLFLRALSLDKAGQLNSFEQMIKDYLQYHGYFWQGFIQTYERTEGAFFLDENILSIREQLSIKYQAFLLREPYKDNHDLHKVDFKNNAFNAIVLTDNFGSETQPIYIYDRWIFFESSWAEEHPDLANSIDRYFSRWDCLE